MLSALTSAGTASSIGVYLIKHPSEYIFHFGKITKISTRTRERQPLKFYPFRENKNLCVCHHVDLHLDKMKDFHIIEAQLLLILLKLIKGLQSNYLQMDFRGT